jgi:hypothetical protein
MAALSNWPRRLGNVFQLSHSPWLFLMAALVLILAYWPPNYIRQEPSNAPAVDSGIVTLCMDRYGTKKELQVTDLQLVTGVYELCYNVISTGLVAQEQTIRNDNFIFQRFENRVLMYMVVLITVSGVILAALQLYASYKLAIAGKGALSDGGELNVNWNSMALKSSVVGVVILGISFAFFLVFVLYVYTLRDDRTVGPQSSSQAAQTSTTNQLQQGNLPEYPNIGKAVPRQPSPTATPNQPNTATPAPPSGNNP